MKGRRRALGVETRGLDVSFGQYGLRCMETQWITSRQIEAARRAVIRYLKKGGKLWIRVFPDKPITYKGTEVPMGGGKGSVDHYVFAAKPGRILFELDGLPEEEAREAFRKAGTKLPVKTNFVIR